MTDTSKDKTPTDTPSTPERFTLKTGTCVTVDGVEVRLVSDTEIESDQKDHDVLAELAGTTFEEYPKRVKSSDGVEKNVNSAEEEAAWCRPTRLTELKDVTVKHDAKATRDSDRKR